ncbi:VPS10 domain-containing protein [Aegicerativicinus sediminis]|uniref:VPS10 domain-containing protein n=1 Tax=Aegicerativicinus sediminis TaxID=2893202 RepID=UPI001E283CE3|nr:glycosyl hydrolase [Aegicerativicinus sediminis]
MKLSNFLLAVLLGASFSFAQPTASSLGELQNSIINLKSEESSSLVKNIEFTNIGPTVMSGRVVDLAVNPDNSTEFYVAYASGGLWYTNNNGISFEPVMDNSNTQNIGAIAVDWKNNIIWVGTGETNASRSSYAGIGLLRSKDKGESWENVGLQDSHHIGKILINPNNPNEVVVGVTGHLYSESNDRGIYKTTDGGLNWSHTLFVDPATGIIDLQMAPEDFRVMYASSWTKDRKAWNFDGNGENSAIYKSTDAGSSWQKLTTPESGFPTGTGVGRIGLAVFNENIIYAIHDNQFHRPKTEVKKPSDELQKDDFKNMSNREFLNLDNSKLNRFLKQNGFQEKYRAENVKNLVESGVVKPADLALYLEDANAQLFDTPVIGAEVFISENGGRTWSKTHEGYLDDLYYSYGYYFGHIHVSPKNRDHIYVYGVPILSSKDGGKTYKSIDAENVHADHHALWIDPKNPNHLINGNDGGVNITYDDGKHWLKNNTPSVGQFYAINVDNEKPYNVYGGLQDNGVWKGPNNHVENYSWYDSGDYPWKRLMGGDGMQVQIDNRDSNIVYTGFQFGNYYRLNLKTGERAYIQPKHELGDSPYRFNWQTPVLLSSHNQDIVYFGANKLLRSLDKGNTWSVISPDLTNGGKKGNVAYGTITSISESPFQFGLIVVGTDDGNIYVGNGGITEWKKVGDSLPQDQWVSRVVASQHNKNRIYVTLNGYRWDDFTPYVYVSDDLGETWKSIAANIPASPVNVIKEDPSNEDILYLGTDNAAYVSMDRGETWQMFSNGLPKVAIHDLVIQPQANDLLLGTHGRSIYKTNVVPIQQMAGKDLNKSFVIFKVDDIRKRNFWGRSFSQWSEPVEPSTTINYYSSEERVVIFELTSEKGTLLTTFRANAEKGFNSTKFDLSIPEKGRNALEKENNKVKIPKAENGKFYLPEGSYKIKANGQEVPLVIK